MTQVKIFEHESNLEKAINDWLRNNKRIGNIKIKSLGISPSRDMKVMIIYWEDEV